MQAAGCGFRAVLSSNSSSTAIALLALDVVQTLVVTLSGEHIDQFCQWAFQEWNFHGVGAFDCLMICRLCFQCRVNYNVNLDLYFRRYLPKLKGFPSRYIYEPWNAPESVQKAAKCIIGIDYPKPMVNHAETSRLNIERMKQIYQQLSRYRGLCKYWQLHCAMELSSIVSVVKVVCTFYK